MHVNQKYMKNVINLLHSIPFNNCCAAHGDLPSRIPDFDPIRSLPVVEIHVDGYQLFLSSDLIAYTDYWDRYKYQPVGSTVVIPEDHVCAFHQCHQCNRKTTCFNVHLCRTFWSWWCDRIFDGRQPCKGGTDQYKSLSTKTMFIRLLMSGVLSVQFGTLDDFDVALERPPSHWLVEQSLKRLRTKHKYLTCSTSEREQEERSLNPV